MIVSISLDQPLARNKFVIIHIYEGTGIYIALLR